MAYKKATENSVQAFLLIGSMRPDAVLQTIHIRNLFNLTMSRFSQKNHILCFSRIESRQVDIL